MKCGPHPRHVSDITPAWLTAVLRESGTLSGAAVIGVDAGVIGEGVGFLSSVGRVQLTYDTKESNAPDSVVVKIEPESESFREIGNELHAFEREIRFYREVATQLSIRLPRTYATVMEPPDYVIIMEDLSYCRPGDQIAGLHTRGVVATARVMAHIQASFWNNAATESLSWMPRTNAFGEGYREHWPGFVEYARDRISPEAMRIGHRVGACVDWIEEEMTRAPTTVVHNDLRADNLLFDETGAEETVFIVDWQLATRSMGAFDIARLLGASEPRAERSGHQLEVVRAWYDTLVANGVSDYTWDDAMYHVRVGALAMLEIPLAFREVVVNQGGRGIDLMDLITRRAFAFVEEIDAASVLPKK